MDERSSGGAAARLTGDRRAAREAARARRSRRGQAIAAASSVVVLGGLAALVLTSPGWPEVRDTFFSWEVFKDSFPGVLEGFWLDVKLFVIVELAVLVLGLVVALVRTSGAPALFPLRLLAGGLLRHFQGDSHDPAGLPRRLRDSGAAARGAPDRPGRARRRGARSVLRRLCGRGVPRGDRLGAPRPARRGAGHRAHRGPGDAVRDPAPGGAPGGPAAAQRLHLAAEGRRADLDPGAAGGVPDRPDRRLVDVQLHAADRRRAALPVRHGAAGQARRSGRAGDRGQTR